MTEPTFIRHKASQRPHRKSRLGCKVCKARKIKCDEVRPVCTQCVRRFPNPEEECEFETIFAPIYRSRSSRTPRSTSDPVSGVVVHPTHSTSNGPPPSMERRLFYHYATCTALSMPLCEEPCALLLWTIDIPSIAFEFQSVYNAVLGVAALHLLSQNPDDDKLRAAACHYTQDTISSHRVDLSDISSRNSEALLATSTLINMHAKLCSRYLKDDSTTHDPLAYFRLQDGVRNLLRGTLSLDPSSKMQTYLRMEPYLDYYHTWIPNSGEDIFPHDPLIPYITSNSEITFEKRTIYDKTLERVLSIKNAILSGHMIHWVRRLVVATPAFVPSGIVSLLEERDPLALAIIARYFALMKFVDQPWWMQGNAEHEIYGLVSLTPEDQQWMMAWPLGILENWADDFFLRGMRRLSDGTSPVGEFDTSMMLGQDKGQGFEAMSNFDPLLTSMIPGQDGGPSCMEMSDVPPLRTASMGVKMAAPALRK